MRKLVITVLAVFLLVVFSSCYWPWKKWPTDQENTRWVSLDPDIYFEVSAKFNDITKNNTYGKINIDGVVTEIAVSFDFGDGVEFRPAFAFTDSGGIDGDAWLFMGKWDFSPDKLVVDITNNTKGFLDDSIKTITFYREEIE
jgi:hypothetical protein